MKTRSFVLGLAMAAVALTLAAAPGLAQFTIPQPVLNPAFDTAQGGYAYDTTPHWAYTKPLRKFVDGLPGLGAAGANNLGQYIPVAVPDTNAFPGSDYYEIGLQDFRKQMHSDLPVGGTRIRGYYQKNGTAESNAKQYLGPLIIAQRDRPVRVKFYNELGRGLAGRLFIPVDTTVMGAGIGPDMMHSYGQNRAAIHLHGGFTPWVSDGTAHQWITPANDSGPWRKGLSFANVPDMAYGPKLPNPNNMDGIGTFYYSNQQSSRLMFYHDHAYGITRLNVYAGEAAGYLLTDAVEEGLINNSTLPNLGGNYRYGIPLIIQDKTFCSATTTATDPLWRTAVPSSVRQGDLWFPHVYQPNFMPPDGAMNPKGRWDYGPFFWPPIPITEPMLPALSLAPEAYMDTPVVNGTAYPYLDVQPRAYRFRILNACNDRILNLQLYYADPLNPKEVKMVPANGQTVVGPYGPATVPSDGRYGGVPDPATAGPAMIQIGTEGGFLPGVVILNNPPKPVNYDYDRRSATLGNVTDKTLFLGPAERADIIIDFSAVPAGSTLILYNDAPAPTPLFDPRYDFYTGNPDYSATGLDMGGAPSTQAGFGPNTRTLMQFRVAGAASPAFNVAGLQAALPTAYANSHNTADDPAFVLPTPDTTPPGGAYADNRFSSVVGVQQGLTFQGLPVKLKTLIEDFDMAYGRMNTMLGTEQTSLNPDGQNAFGYKYIDPPTEDEPEGTAQIWTLVHNGVDTHAIHFHLFTVQVINRVDWAGIIKPPDPNELGWKETVRMNPLENVVLAVKFTKPKLPFGIPKSKRPLDVTKPLGSTMDFTNPGPNGLPTTNIMFDFDWEYVWHCHLLGHEENDMMRAMAMRVTTAKPPQPTGLAAAAAGGAVNLSWSDPTPASAPATLANPANEVSFKIQRATDSAFTVGLKTLTAPANATTMTDASVVPGTPYFYRLRGYNATGFSTYSNTANITP